ncbi:MULTISPECIES: FliH/SctL family protein [Clostridium]|uniref:FliH/SctL family protein n=1 Tax=Clostridium TaxID=1485 RepID=UPI000CF69589|nr:MULTISPECIES: FliH/SctL family protein [Clostridium]MBN1044511.1 flagellar biosynthesis protein [Clostridium botulinum]NFN92772.1 flagellar biosynthesis protein [Clostridium botulinum]NFS27774.1 flagellar biosynthesis protein [Clostridium botulinum]NFS53579.1 flagellar biosynthesis protein [Clostridium botulinum]NFS95634.1 flagellar biosynthesis protein [Clostridium botulinum]
MQSSYSIIKKNCALDAEKKKISTEYVSKKIELDENFEEVQEEVYSKEEVDALIAKYEEIGKRIIQDANNEKQGIILRGTMQAQNLEKEAYEKGYEEGLQNGYDDGYKKAYDENIDLAKAKSQEIIDKAEDVLRSANENYAKYLEDKKSDILKLSLEIAKNILRKELGHEDSMNLLVEEAIQLSKDEENLIIKCNSLHAEELKSQVNRWKISYSIKDEIFILNDDFIEPGNAIIEKPNGKVIVGFDIGMEAIKKEILGQD